MKNKDKLARNISTALGLITTLWFGGNYIIFELLRPKMIAFQQISEFEEGLMNYVGIGWLMMFGFLLVSFFRIVNFLKTKNFIRKYFLLLLGMTVISTFFIFGDIALISDIGNQYKAGLSQPEWLIMYLVTAFQLTNGILLTHANYFLIKKSPKKKLIIKDSNIFTLAQYIGTLCGAFGVAIMSGNFSFSRPLWMVKYHMFATSLFLLVPYVLIIVYWLVIKFQEKSLQIYDEKQIQDISASSFITLFLSLLIMGILYSTNFNNLEDMLSVIWFPFLVFLMLFLFSFQNLLKSRDNLG